MVLTMIHIIKRTTKILRMAWLMRRTQKATKQSTQQAAQHALSEMLAGSRGLPMKVGQIMAGMEEDSAYSKLTQSIEPLPLKHILPVLEAAWGMPIHYKLQSIDESCAAASLGQVHHAQLNAHEHVAIKVQYPDIANAIHAELKLAGLLPAAGPMKRWSFDLNSYKRTLNNTLKQELDYLHEMKQQLAFYSSIDIDGLHVPRVFPVLCRSNVLVQEWVQGVRLSQAATWGENARTYIAQTLMKTMFQSVFEVGLVHGDPHPGNMLFQHHADKPQTILLDFGCMIQISEVRRMALLKLILASRNACPINAYDAFVALGFDANKLSYIKAFLPELMHILFQPFKNEHVFDTKAWTLSDDVAQLLGDQRWWFRSACPADFFLIIRIFQGLISQLETLQIQLPWWQMLDTAIKQKSIERCLQWQPGTAIPKEEVTYFGSAEKLHINIQRDDKKPIEISLPANQALELHGIVPEHSRHHIEASGIDLLAMRERLLKEGLEPQTLIDIKTDTHRYHVWLS
jgi:predicted unusual protein kinase regulating ubiquinone biosynthesis (AarF/ABC1/UbiB family)